MKTKLFKLISSFDSLMLGVLLATPDDTNGLKGVIQFSHGMTERKERYLKTIDFFTSHGFVCIIHDHRGHGESVKKDDDLGYFYEHGSDAVVEDMAQISKYIKNLYPDLPLFIIAHSMGTLITRVYLKKYDKLTCGVFLCGSPSPNDGTGVIAPVLNRYAKLRGDNYRGKMINDLFSGRFNSHFKDEHLKNAWTCSDVNVVKAFSEDPKCGFSFTINGYQCLLELMNKTYVDNIKTAQNPYLPIMFLSGSDDACMISRKKLLESVAKQQEAGYYYVGHKIYNGMRHAILNETDRMTVYKDILKNIEIFKTIKEQFNSDK